MKMKVDQIEHYIMKNCLWQFNSRGWDREIQNQEIITRTTGLLCGERVRVETLADRYYRAEAVCLSDALRERCPWLLKMSKPEISAIMQTLKERLDYKLITASLNQELTKEKY